MRHEVRVLLVTSVLVTLVVASASGCSLLFEGSPNLYDAATEVDASESDAAPDANTSDAGAGDLVHDLDMGLTTQVGGNGDGPSFGPFECPGSGVVMAVRARPWVGPPGFCDLKVQCGYLQVLDSGEVQREPGAWIPSIGLGDHASCLDGSPVALSCPGASVVVGATVTVPQDSLYIGSLQLSCASITGHGDYEEAATVTTAIGTPSPMTLSTTCTEPAVMTAVAGETLHPSGQGTLIKNLALGCHTLKHQ